MPLRLFLLLSALGGAIGATARWGALALAPDGLEPAATVGVNAAGSFLAGALVGAGLRPDRPAWALGVAGFCGGFTTFSSFCLQVADRLAAARPLAAAALVLATVALTLPAAGLGWRAGRARPRPA